VTTIVAAEGVILDRILESTYPLWHEGLTPQAYRKFDAAQMKTAWASSHQRRYALVDGPDLLASAKQYNLAATIDEQPVTVCGIGAVFTEPDRRGRGHARALVERLIDRAARDGAEMALIFPDADRAHDPPDGFERISMGEAEISVAESPRYGAPMTLVRGGEERDLAAIVAMGRIRARPFRFHLDRDIALTQHAITRKRLLAGLGTSGARELHFFIAEEGITAAAYIVVSIVGCEWTIEECGDRDGSGARVGAILQALIAREPIERRPSIRGWLPRGFVPPQVKIASTTPSTVAMMVRGLGSRLTQAPLSGDDVLYWRSDIF
jgi:GNAT superfamily N-acetyltransferase